MPDILHQFHKKAKYSGLLIKMLECECKHEEKDFRFIGLSEILPRNYKKWIPSEKMGEHIGSELLKDSYAVLWAPTSQDSNWFQKLVSEGYKGRRIALLYAECPKLGSDATTAIILPTERLVRKIYDALVMRKSRYHS